MAVISKPVLTFLGIIVVAGLGYILSGNQTPQKSSGAPVKKAAVPPATAQDYRQEDFNQRFARIHAQPRNLFLAPTLPKLATGFMPSSGSIVKVPSALADGDPNWIFTGIAIIDDQKMALLENSSKHLAEYATEGKPWKNSKVLRVSPDGIALKSKDGGDEQVVLRYDPTLELARLPPAAGAAAPDQPNQPVAPPISGPIGPNLQIRHMRRSSPVVMQPGTP